MVKLGHYYDEAGCSAFRVFAPTARQISVALIGQNRTLPLERDALGYWAGSTERLPHGQQYLLDCDGSRCPDPASRYQPEGVHGPSMVTEVARVRRSGWRGVAIEDAIIYELHAGTFTPAGTISAAMERLPYLQALGITVIELLPLAAFPGERNWGYDGTFLFALHAAYGSYDDLRRFIETAHQLGMAVILDVVYNHFGPEGNYTGKFAPYTKAADTPWGAAINFDGEYNYGVREFFLENTRYWLEEVGFDGFRMDAVSLIFDNMPVHILREFTSVAREISRAEGREVLMIAEHLRNDRFVTSPRGFGYHAQWNDDLNHAIFAHLTGETGRHYINFGPFQDVVKALRDGFVLDGTRFDRYYRWFLGTDGTLTHACEHVVHIQDHDQVGNRLLGDRMIATYGRAKALLGITAIMATPFVPMLFMGEEYGETAPFLFFEDFSEQVIIDGAREGRKADFSFGGVEPPDPHARSTFETSKLQWGLRDSAEGQAILAYYREMIALKRSSQLGPRDRSRVRIDADDALRLIRLETPKTLTVLNFSDTPQVLDVPTDWIRHLDSIPDTADREIAAFGARIYRRI